jgi:hypothetical protein
MQSQAYTRLNKLKKQETITVMVAIVAVIALVMYGGGSFSKTASVSTTTTPAASTSGQDVANQLITATQCSGDPNPDVSITVLNKLDTVNNDYLAMTTHFRPITSGATEVDVTTTASSTRVSDTSNAVCNGEYIFVAETNKEDVNAVYLTADPSTGKAFKALSGNGIKTDLRVAKNISLLEVRVKDVLTDAFMNPQLGAAQSSFVSAGSSTVFYSAATNATNEAVGVSETMKYEIQYENLNTKGQFGNQVYLAIDYSGDSDANDWNEPEVRLDGASGKIMSNIKPLLAADDQSALVSYEGVYGPITPPAGSEIKGISVVITSSKDGSTNSDYDLTFRFLGTGVVESSKIQNTYLGVDAGTGYDDGSAVAAGEGKLLARFFDDSSSRAEIVTATAQTLSIPVD